MARLKLWLCALVLVAAGSASARRKPSRRAPARAAAKTSVAQGADPSRWFALRAGLVRLYQGRTSPDGDQPPAGASCEVLESHPPHSGAAGTLREACTLIIARRARPSTEITYELRQGGIFMVRAQGEGAPEPQTMDRLVLPAPVRPGVAWRESLGNVELDRNVRSAGGGCKAAGRSFADCLVLAVVQKQGKQPLRKYTETYAAGVGLVEDAQWELVDVNGL